MNECIKLKQVSLHDQPHELTHLDHFGNMTFRACELCGIFDFDQDDEVEIVPHIVLVTNVLIERDTLVVELGSLQP